MLPGVQHLYYHWHDMNWGNKRKQCKLLWHPKNCFRIRKCYTTSRWMNKHICKACVLYIRKWEEPEHPYSQSGRNKFSVYIEHCSRRILPVNSYHNTVMNKNKWILILWIYYNVERIIQWCTLCCAYQLSNDLVARNIDLLVNSAE